MTKLLKNENIFGNVRLFYIACVLIYAVGRQNLPALQPFLMSDILNILSILGAGALFLWDILFFRNVLKTKYIWILVGIFAITITSSLFNTQYGLVDNIKAAANMFIQFFVLYAVGNRMTKERVNRDVKVIGNVLGAFWMIAVIISVGMYFLDIYYQQTNYIWGDPTLVHQGFVRVDDGAVVMRLWGVFVDPNFAAAMSIIVICLCVYLLHKTAKKWVKALHIVNILFQSLYVVLSNSRMGLIILLLVAFVGCWYVSVISIRKCRIKAIATKRLLREAVAICLSVVFALACYTGVTLSKNVLPYAQYGISHLVFGSSQDSGDADAPEDEIADLDREDISSKDDISNGRLAMWGEGFKVLKKNPVIGVGPRSYHKIATEIDPSLSISERSIHNSFMELLMGNGIIGFLLMLAFFLLCAKDALLIRIKNCKSLFTVGILMIIVLSGMAGGMFISSLFYYLSGISVIVFGLLGYAMAYIRCENEENAAKACEVAE